MSIKILSNAEVSESEEIAEPNKGTYKDFFNSMLDKYNVKSPADLDDKSKSEFFNEIDKGWHADKESD